MVKIRSFVLGVVTALTLSACGSDEGTGKATGGATGSGTGGATGGATGSGTGGATGSGTGGSATGTGGAGVATGGSSKGGSTSTGGSAASAGNAATGGSGGANSCQLACQKVLTANCGDVTQAACSGSCGPTATCVAEVETYYSCIAGRGMVSCGATMNSLVAGCDAEAETLDICSVCDPVSGESACDACTGSSCCTQLKAYVSSADVEGFYACISAATCTTQACLDTCVGMYPSAGKAYNDATSCQSKTCLTPCVCAADTADTACLACVKASCCDAFGGLINSADYGAFNTCLGACAATDAVCFGACVSSSPVAGAAYLSLDSGCLTTTCSADCAG